jgi:hypothetical protein
MFGCLFVAAGFQKSLCFEYFPKLWGHCAVDPHVHGRARYIRHSGDDIWIHSLACLASVVMEDVLVLLLAMFEHIGSQLPDEFSQQATTNFLAVFNEFVEGN